MKLGPLPDADGTPTGRRPDADRTHWIRAFIAFGPMPDALELGFHCVRTHWIRGFIAFRVGSAHPDRDADGVDVT